MNIPMIIIILAVVGLLLNILAIGGILQFMGGQSLKIRRWLIVSIFIPWMPTIGIMVIGVVSMFIDYCHNIIEVIKGQED